MRRLDTLECERAAEELRLEVLAGRLTQAEAAPAIRALLHRGMTDEAAELFDQSCKRLIAGAAYLMVEVGRAQYLPEPDEAGEVPFGHEPEEAAGDEEPWLPFDEEDR